MKNKIKLAIPKGRLYNNVTKLLDDAGFQISGKEKNYRPAINEPDIEVKLLKTQNIPKLVELGSQDIAFTGYDWILEENANVVELLDLDMDKVRIVSSIPYDKNYKKLKKNKIRVVSEYERISKQFLKKNKIDYVFIKSFGATEVFVPEDADMIIDNTSSGMTLKENNLKIVEDILYSSTRFIANKESMKNRWKKSKIESILTMLKGVLEARKRVLIEMNVSKKDIEKLIPFLPSMKSATITELNNKKDCALRVCVEKNKVRDLIPIIKKKGAKDILVYNLQNVIL